MSRKKARAAGSLSPPPFSVFAERIVLYGQEFGNAFVSWTGTKATPCGFVFV